MTESDTVDVLKELLKEWISETNGRGKYCIKALQHAIKCVEAIADAKSVLPDKCKEGGMIEIVFNDLLGQSRTNICQADYGTG